MNKLLKTIGWGFTILAWINFFHALGVYLSDPYYNRMAVNIFTLLIPILCTWGMTYHRTK